METVSIKCIRIVGTYGPGSSVGIENHYALGGAGIESRWGPPSLLYNGYRVFSWGKVRLGRAADHLPSSSTVVREE